MPRTKTKTKTPTPRRRKNPAGVTLSPEELAEKSIDEVWQIYKKSSSDELRNFLIENYLNLVKSTAERMHMRLPGEVDVEDLMSAGLLGDHERIRHHGRARDHARQEAQEGRLKPEA